MTNFERITESPEILAMVITELIHQRDLECLNKLAEKGIYCSLVEIDKEMQIQIHKEWLESESDHLMPM